jgi:4-diphosphocytidyl-2-C-methyl-D-erythritol kinase
LKPSIRLRAFAKINLGLKIVGKRPDGYHEIRTVFQTVALHDSLEISLARGQGRIFLECDDPAIPAGRGNLEAGAEIPGRNPCSSRQTHPGGLGFGGRQ